VGIRAYFASNINENDSDISSNSSIYDLSLFRAGERLSFKMEYLDVGKSFNTKMGFISRRDIRTFRGFILNPIYIESEKYWRFVPGFSYNFISDHNGVLQDSDNKIVLTLDFQSHDRISMEFRRKFENIPFDFPIFKSILVPEGKYTYFDSKLQLTTKPGRTFSSVLLITGGQFLDGSHIGASISNQLKLNQNLTISQFYNISHRDLNFDAFTAHVMRTRIEYSMNTSLSVSSIVQYDNASEKLGMNLRLNYIFSEGTDLFIVYDQINDEPGISDKISFGRNNNSSLLVKFNYLFSL